MKEFILQLIELQPFHGQYFIDMQLWFTYTRFGHSVSIYQFIINAYSGGYREKAVLP
jgi:hypothetical protein